MQVTLAHVGARGGAKDAFEEMVSRYLKRCAGVMRCTAEACSKRKSIAGVDGQTARQNECEGPVF